MSAWFDELARSALVPPDDELKAWASSQPSFEAAFEACPRVPWLMWLAAANTPNEKLQRRIIARGVSIVRFSHNFFEEQLAMLAPLATPIQLADAWVHNGVENDQGTVIGGRIEKAGFISLAINIIAFNLSGLPRYYLPRNWAIGLLFMVSFGLCFVAFWIFFSWLRQLQLRRSLPSMNFQRVFLTVYPQAFKRDRRRGWPKPVKADRSVGSPGTELEFAL